MYREFVEAFQNYGATNLEILMALLFLAGLVIAFITRNIWEKKKAKGQRKRVTRRKFMLACRNKGLLPDEVNFLINSAIKVGLEVDTSLIESNISFDQFAFRVLQSGDDDEQEKLNADLSALRNKLGFRPPPRGFALNSTRELPGGQLLYIAIAPNVFLEGRTVYVDETMLTVRLQAGRPSIRLRAGKEVSIHFSRTGDARYSGSCSILRTASNEEGQHIRLSHCNELRRDQRRRDFRVDDDRTICLWVMDEQMRQAEDPFRIIDNRMPERARLEDISGGGASIIFHRSLSSTKGIFINLDPGRTYGLPIVRGTVIRSKRRSRMDRWAMSIRFEDLRPSEHQKIVSHVFMKERDQLKIA